MPPGHSRPDFCRPIRTVMPALLAIVVASSLAWVIKDALPAPEGVPLPTLIAFVAWIVAVPLLKRFFSGIRPPT